MKTQLMNKLAIAISATSLGLIAITASAAQDEFQRQQILHAAQTKLVQTVQASSKANTMTLAECEQMLLKLKSTSNSQ